VLYSPTSKTQLLTSKQKRNKTTYNKNHRNLKKNTNNIKISSTQNTVSPKNFQQKKHPDFFPKLFPQLSTSSSDSLKAAGRNEVVKALLRPLPEPVQVVPPENEKVWLLGGEFLGCTYRSRVMGVNYPPN